MLAASTWHSARDLNSANEDAMRRLRDVMWLGLAGLLACGGSSAATNAAETPDNAAPSTEAAATEAVATDETPKCPQLMTRLCADLGPTTETCELVKTRTAELTETQCQAMVQHYDEVLAELVAYEARNQPLPPTKVAQMLDGAVAVSGPQAAAVTIVVFSDFQCPFCAGAANATHDIQRRYGDRVRIVFRQFPLPFHRNAHLAAQAALAANVEGKFWPMHDLLFANQQDLERDSLERYAKELGLNVAAFKRALDDRSHAAAVDADLELGISLGVDATPTMFLNGRRVPNASDIDAIAAQIDAQLTPPTGP